MSVRTMLSARRAVRAAASVLLAIVASDPAAAQTPRLTDLSLEALADIQVTSAAKQPESVWDTPVAIHVISREDIRRSGATTLPELLRLAPGVEVERIDSAHWAVGVRGFSDQFSKSLLVLIDGRSVYTPLFAGMYWPAYDTAIEDVERIEIIRGPGGTIWGANAVNGVINIITRSAADTRGTLVSTGAGGRERGVTVRQGWGLGERGAIRVYAKGTDRDGQVHPDGSDYDAWWTAQAGARADWTRGANQLTVEGDLSRGDHGQRVISSSFRQPFERVLDGSLEATGANVVARWQRALASDASLQVEAYWDYTNWAATHFEERRNTFDVDVVHYFGTAGGQRITWGFGARRSPSQFTQTLSSLSFEPARQTDSVYSAFVQDEIPLAGERLRLTLGSKFERNNYTGLESQPAARVLWRLRPAQSVWASVSHAVRTPSRIERGVRSIAYNPNVPAVVPVFIEADGNAGFDAERLTGYEAGYRARVATRLNVDLAVFHNEHRGLASFGPNTVVIVPGPPVVGVLKFPYVNGVDGSSNGFEIAPDWQPAGWMQVKGSYSYFTADLGTRPISIDPNAIARYEGASPHHQVRVQIHAALPRGWDVDPSYRYVSDLPFRLVDGYHSAGLRVGTRIGPRFDLSVVAENLFSPEHIEFGQAGRTPVAIARQAYVNLTWRPPIGQRP